MVKHTKSFLLFLGIIAAALLPGCRTPSDYSVIDSRQEKTIGDWAAAQIQSESTVPPDPLLVSEVDEIASRLDQVLTVKIVPRILISDSDSDSVSSLPGGWVIISEHMIILLKDNPDALAGILAHEFAHVESDDAMKEMINALGADTMLDMTSQGKYIDASNVAVQLTNFGHDADVEYDADAEGVRIASAAGYNPKGILTAIQLLKVVDPPEDAVWLQVHPVTVKRIKYLTTEISWYPPKPQNTLVAK